MRHHRPMHVKAVFDRREEQVETIERRAARGAGQKLFRPGQILLRTASRKAEFVGTSARSGVGGELMQHFRSMPAVLLTAVRVPVTDLEHGERRRDTGSSWAIS